MGAFIEATPSIAVCTQCRTRTRFLHYLHRTFIGGAGHVKCGLNRLILLRLHFAQKTPQARCVVRPFFSGCIFVRPSMLWGRSAMSAPFCVLCSSTRTGDAVHGTAVSFIVGAALGSSVCARFICFDASVAAAVWRVALASASLCALRSSANTVRFHLAAFPRPSPTMPTPSIRIPARQR
jgi:hypothetical protein